MIKMSNASYINFPRKPMTVVSGASYNFDGSGDIGRTEYNNAYSEAKYFGSIMIDEIIEKEFDVIAKVFDAQARKLEGLYRPISKRYEDEKRQADHLKVHERNYTRSMNDVERQKYLRDLNNEYVLEFKSILTPDIIETQKLAGKYVYYQNEIYRRRGLVDDKTVMKEVSDLQKQIEDLFTEMEQIYITSISRLRAGINSIYNLQFRVKEAKRVYLETIATAEAEALDVYSTISDSAAQLIKFKTNSDKIWVAVERCKCIAAERNSCCSTYDAKYVRPESYIPSEQTKRNARELVNIYSYDISRYNYILNYLNSMSMRDVNTIQESVKQSRAQYPDNPAVVNMILGLTTNIQKIIDELMNLDSVDVPETRYVRDHTTYNPIQ